MKEANATSARSPDIPGARVGLVEARRIGSGATGHTTAKITSLHALTYRRLVSDFGEEAARAYGAANEIAIGEMERLVREEGIDCGFRRKAHVTVATTEQQLDAVREEADIASRLDLPAEFTLDVDLPMPVTGAVRFDDQAEFHPMRYVAALARLVAGEGCAIFEGTRALDVDEGPQFKVRTTSGAVSADHVVVATHFPFLDRGGYFARMHAERSYVIGRGPRGRQEPDTEGCYASLEDWARQHFDVVSVDWRWSAQDPVPVDGMPFIGPLRPGVENLHVATGFAKWGMAHATGAGQILADAIAGRPNPWAALYDPTRVEPVASAKDFVTGTSPVSADGARPSAPRPTRRGGTGPFAATPTTRSPRRSTRDPPIRATRLTADMSGRSGGLRSPRAEPVGAGADVRG